MEQVTFILRTLTPLFLAGADQADAELRPPTFRGLMRYWYRALVGGMVGTTAQGLKQVMAAETALFGSTNRGSVVQIRISDTSTEVVVFGKEPRGRDDATGRDYLFWSMAGNKGGRSGNPTPARGYYPTGTSFQVTLSVHGTESACLKQAIVTFWLLTQLGGLGSRSRRCGGSLTVQAVQNNLTNLPFSVAANVQALQLQLKQGIQEAKRLAKEFHQLEPRSIPPATFDILTPGVCRIWILQNEQPWSSAEEAMRELGANLQDYRSKIFPLERRAIFGLPLPRMDPNKRRASPLLLRVAELQEKKYVGIAVLFKTAESNGRSEDYTLIEEWVDNFCGKREVML